MMVYQIVITGVFLSICTYTDTRYGCIYRKAVISMLILSIAGHIAEWIWVEKPDMGAIILSLIPGACCFLVSLLTREALGYGDSMVVAVCGIAIGTDMVMGLLMGGLFLAALWAIYLCVFQKADRRREFPFCPFLLAAFAVQILEICF